MRDITGKNNPRWNDGSSEYQNHAQLKRNRVIKLQQAEGKCEICGKEAYCVHHLDGSTDNHEMENLVVTCRKCHCILHAGKQNGNFSKKPKTSKYIRLYGMTLREMVESYGGSAACYYQLHKNGKLEKILRRMERSEQNNA